MEGIDAYHGAEKFPHDFPLTILLSANTCIPLQLLSQHFSSRNTICNLSMTSFLLVLPVGFHFLEPVAFNFFTFQQLGTDFPHPRSHSRLLMFYTNSIFQWKVIASTASCTFNIFGWSRWDFSKWNHPILLSNAHHFNPPFLPEGPWP